MNPKFQILLLIVSLLLHNQIYAVPAYNKAFKDTLPDGSVIKIYKHGDERLHWITNDKNERIERDNTGFYKILPNYTPNEINALRQNSRFAQKNNTPQKISPISTPPSVLVILVNFADVAFQTPKDTIDSLFMGNNFHRSYSYYDAEAGGIKYYSATGSVRQYFRDASMGQYIPNFKIVGPYTLPQKRKYYGENDASGQDTKAEEMIKDACDLVSAYTNINFSQFDADGDGDIDVVMVLYAGYGEADALDATQSDYVWPHQSSFDEYYYKIHSNVTFNGKRLNRYACFNEISFYSNTYAGIGTICHEYSHILGLPDLYPSGNDNYKDQYTGYWKTMGEWDIMDYGNYNNDGNTPPTYSGYERFFMGWGTPVILSQGNNQIEIPELQQSNKFYLASPTTNHNLIGNNPSPSEFYILENRQQKGWDTYIPGHGLLLTKIKYLTEAWDVNRVNYRKNNMRVDIIEADGYAPQYSKGKPGDAFPTGASSYNDTRFNLYIQNITEVNQQIYMTCLQTNLQPNQTLLLNTTCYKTIENGKMIIYKNGQKYNILGNQL